ncbi:hypothetical protein [Allosphingosinicella indica]|uniref:Uncharacterized protein n=1 Tax=Allosphingosinicella indica TaxID=941907 RepID=A0A1X7H314_9SPHN|nr:hypothetical protein [Allosphingosinicella indica]SMF78929.1 hypothetical protein SAMN06295910_2781 [Allosphingosinicella indica]
MSETPKTPEEKREAAAIRRRWITLGELLAVAAVVISALTFWNSYSERRSSDATRAAEAEERAAAKARDAERNRRITLRAAIAEDGRTLTVAPVDEDQAVQSLAIAFPKDLRAAPIDAVIEPRIESRWLRDAARAARRLSGRENQPGDRRLPVAITTRFITDGETFTDVTLYDIGYRIDGSLLGGTEVTLRGLSQLERARASNAQARLDAIWQSRRSSRR